MTAEQVDAALAELLGLLLDADRYREWRIVRQAATKVEDLRLALRKEG